MSELKRLGPYAEVDAVIDAPLSHVWQAFVNMDIPAVFCEAKGPLPPVLAVSDATGPWDVAGSSRLLSLGDGSAVTEMALEVSAPTEGAARLMYEVTGYAPPFDKLTQRARGEWRFGARGDRTAVSWAYAYEPTGLLARPVLMMLNALFWKAYMRDALDRFAQTCAAA